MTDKQYECIASQMWFEASRKRTKHEPLAGTNKPFYLGGRIFESDVKQLDKTIEQTEIREIFEKLEIEGKGTVDKSGKEWIFDFNEYNDIYHPGFRV
jgi:hypothetical protein